MSIEGLGDLVLAADVSDRPVAAEAGQDDLQLLLGRELSVIALGCQLDLLRIRAAILSGGPDALVAPSGLLGIRVIQLR